MIKFTIYLKPRTKKNSSQIITVRGKPRIIPSKLYRDYERECALYLKPLHIDYPVNVKAHYYMPTRRRVDLCNLHECLCDVLVKHGVVDDDNSKIIESMDGSRVFYDKECPRTEVWIEEVDGWKDT